MKYRTVVARARLARAFLSSSIASPVTYLLKQTWLVSLEQGGCPLSTMGVRVAAFETSALLHLYLWGTWLCKGKP